MSDSKKIVCFGEVLWDVFPDAKVIGGAPLNVALRLNSQGHSVSMISRLGQDEAGREAFQHIQKMGLPTEGLQWDESLPTGEVLITIDSGGSARYVITEPVACDAIEYSEEGKRLVTKASILVFGSLVCRRPKSKATLEQLISHAHFTVFDVNLRPPFYTMELLESFMLKSDFVKMNDEEVVEITNALGIHAASLKECAYELINRFSLKGLCVTEGAHGAFLIWEGTYEKHPGYTVEVHDTVGAGDSFLATLIGELLVNGAEPSIALDKACAYGALVASKAGANCTVTESELKMLLPNS